MVWLAAAVLLTAGLAALPAKANGYVVNVEWTSETALYLPTSGITVYIENGSEADTLTMNPDGESFTVSVPEGSTFRVAYKGPEPGTMTNDAGIDDCVWVGGNNRLEIRGSREVTVTPEETPECRGGGGGGGSVAPFVRLLNPNGGQVFGAGDTYTVTWNATGFGLVTMDLLLSVDGGESWNTFATDEINDGQHLWTIPAVDTDNAYIKAEVISSTGSMLAQDYSDSAFSIEWDGVPPEEGGDPFMDPNTTGGYDSDSARESTSSINSDKNIPQAPEGEATYCQSGSLIKSPDNPAVYYCGADGKRYVFPNSAVYFSWYPDFSGVVTITPEDLAKIPLGGNVTYKPGVRMVKIQSDPKTYAVARGGVLRWVTTEAVARALYGDNWNQFIDDINVAFFLNYVIGDPITEADVGL